MDNSNVVKIFPCQGREEAEKAVLYDARMDARKYRTYAT